MVPLNWSRAFSMSSLVTPSNEWVDRTGPSESYVVVAAPNSPQLSYSLDVSLLLCASLLMVNAPLCTPGIVVGVWCLG